MTNDGTQVATWKGGGIGRMSGAVRSRSVEQYTGAATSTGKLASLNNLVGVFEFEIDEAGNTSAKVWEWK